MEATPDYVMFTEGKAAARIDARQANYEAARTLLANEFVNAFRAGSMAKVSTPAFNRPTMPIGDVFHDSLSDKGGDQTIADLFDIINASVRGEVVTHRFMAWIAARAYAHAEYHADDLADQIGGEA